MERNIWCYACAAYMRLTEEDLRTEWRTVRWGFVSRPDLTCDECGCDLPGGAFAACVTNHRRAGEYRPWEGRFVIPREVCDEDLEHEPNPEVREYVAHYCEIQAFEIGRSRKARASERPELAGEAEQRSGGGEDEEAIRVREKLFSASVMEGDSCASCLAAIAAVEDRSTAVLRLSLVLVTSAGVMLGLTFFGG